MFFRFQKSKKISVLTSDFVHVISGKVITPKELKIPGTDVKCACYWMMTEAWKQPERKKGRKMWMPIGARQGSNGFFVEDNTGKIWVDGDANVLEIRNGWEDSGIVGKKGTRRFVSRSIQSGDVVKIRGTVCKAKGKEPGDCLVIRPDAKGVLSIIQKKKTSASLM